MSTRIALVCRIAASMALERERALLLLDADRFEHVDPAGVAALPIPDRAHRIREPLFARGEPAGALRGGPAVGPLGAAGDPGARVERDGGLPGPDFADFEGELATCNATLPDPLDGLRRDVTEAHDHGRAGRCHPRRGVGRRRREKLPAHAGRRFGSCSAWRAIFTTSASGGMGTHRRWLTARSACSSAEPLSPWRTKPRAMRNSLSFRWPAGIGAASRAIVVGSAWSGRTC